jgi:hypothetical protein
VPIARDVPEAGERAAHCRHNLGMQRRHGQHHQADDDRYNDRRDEPTVGAALWNLLASMFACTNGSVISKSAA